MTQRQAYARDVARLERIESAMRARPGITKRQALALIEARRRVLLWRFLLEYRPPIGSLL